MRASRSEMAPSGGCWASAFRLAATLWGILLAPKSSRQVRDPARLGMEILIFGGAVAALLGAGKATLAVVLGGLVALHLVLTFVLGQR